MQFTYRSNTEIAIQNYTLSTLVHRCLSSCELSHEKPIHMNGFYSGGFEVKMEVVGVCIMFT